MQGEAQPGAVASEEVTTAATAAPGSEATAAPNAESSEAKPEGDKQPDAKPERTFTQKELDEIVRKRAAQAERQARRAAQAEHDAYLRGRAEAGGEREPQRASAANDKEDQEPNEKDFPDYESYLRAVTRYEIRQEGKQAEQQRARQERERGAIEQAKADHATLMKGANEFADFEDVVFADEAPITKPMMVAILESDMPSKVAYYLASPENRDEALKIAELPSTRQAARVHALAEKLAAAPKPNPLPAPIKPNGGDSKVEIDPDKLPYDKWLAWRREQPDLNRPKRRP